MKAVDSKLTISSGWKKLRKRDNSLSNKILGEVQG
jgi:hypothetical protein